jgi:putative intracellular protease/amidase
MRIVIPIYDRFTALDAVGPYEVLSRLPGAEVVFAATTAGPKRTDVGSLAITADATLDEIDSADIITIPGGPGTRQLMTDPELIGFVQRIHPTTTWTTSVCTGSLLLGAAGILDGLKATTHWSADELLNSTGATYVEERVVIEGKVITAAGVSAGIDMALTLAAKVAGDVVAQAIQLGIEYDPQPPFDSGAVSKAAPEIVEFLRAGVTDRG